MSIFRARPAYPILLTAFVGITAPAVAADVNCGLPLQVTKRLVESNDGYIGYAGKSRVPAFLAASEPDTGTNHRGTTVFVRMGKKWKAFAPWEGEFSQGIFVGIKSDVFIFTMIMTEGPGSSWTLFLSNDGFATARCVSIPFPSELNQPAYNGEYLEFQDFNLTSQGEGAVVGSADIEREGSTSQTWWFKYTTTDSGRTWSKPIRLASKPPRQGGVLEKVEGNVPRLYKSLRLYVGRK